LSVPPIFWLELGMVFASPAVEIPAEAELLVLLLLFLPLDPHAATASAHATATTAMRAVRKRRI
jgi:hypothetical protein